MRFYGRLYASTLIALLYAVGSSRSVRADVLLQGFYWDVPSPQTGQANAPWWWDNLASQARELSESGFTSVWIPPVVKGANAQYSVGYDPFDDYDIGSKNQHGYVSSRYGTREQLERCVAIMRANGLNVIVTWWKTTATATTTYSFATKTHLDSRMEGASPKRPMIFIRAASLRTRMFPKKPPKHMGMFGPDVAHVNGKNRHIYNGLIDAGTG